jgi:hypothetical protein
MSIIRRILGDFRHLCKPAMVYLAISVVALVAIAYQNMGMNNMYCMGNFSCYVPSTTAVIFSEALYILFWTWILHLMCRTGYASISWFMVVFPLVLFFVLIGLMMLASRGLTQSGRVPRMQPIERRDVDNFKPMFPPGPPMLAMREGMKTKSGFGLLSSQDPIPPFQALGHGAGGIMRESFTKRASRVGGGWSYGVF